MRDLQYLQASMLWLDIAAFCGFRRKMEIAESSLQPLVTVREPLIVFFWPSLSNTSQALRRAGKLDKVSYIATSPAADDTETA